MVATKHFEVKVPNTPNMNIKNRDQISDIDEDIALARKQIEELKAKGRIQRERFAQEEHEMKERLASATEKFRRTVDEMVKTANHASYIQAMRVDDFVPSVVLAYQAKLCLHMHLFCIAEMNRRNLKKDRWANIEWLEEVTKMLQDRKTATEARLKLEIEQLGGCVEETVQDPQSNLESAPVLDKNYMVSSDSRIPELMASDMSLDYDERDEPDAPSNSPCNNKKSLLDDISERFSLRHFGFSFQT